MPLKFRVAEEADFDFALHAKRDAMRPHVVVRWEWDEPWQLEHHRLRWQTKPWQIICLNSANIGTVSIDVRSSHLLVQKEREV